MDGVRVAAEFREASPAARPRSWRSAFFGYGTDWRSLK